MTAIYPRSYRKCDVCQREIEPPIGNFRSSRWWRLEYQPGVKLLQLVQYFRGDYPSSSQLDICTKCQPSLIAWVMKHREEQDHAA